MFVDGLEKSASDQKICKDYYAFGALMPGRNYSPDSYRFGFNGMEMDNEVKGTGNSLDFGARIYDPRLGRWLACDPLAVKYPDVSPYTFVLNTPIQAIDPDGKVVIFIGGNHFSPINSSGNSAAYWREYDKDGNETYAFDKEVMQQFNDYKSIYRDGSLGGWAPMNLGIFDDETNMTVTSRRNAGSVQGMKDAKPILDNLKDGETIKIVTHSMGAAFAKGYIDALKTYMKENNINAKIEIEVDFAPYQSDDYGNSAYGSRSPYEEGKGSVPTSQYSHKDDGVAGDKQMRGAKKQDTSGDPSGNGLERHGIMSFKNSVKKLGQVLNKIRQKGE
ncbi:MAG: hypothetical protein CO098_18255 [Bacteroidetes bacterium CG_4_9_14_3_um_filter_41_19]|nr:MAG: hypothetical protein CO098_18255 [Bacteroidetes bacterium CG_4_9_14_3_um_filter_41_19]